MRLQFNDDGSVDAYVRQSWLNDATMCNERGRNGIIRPDWSGSNELTNIGTAVHVGAAGKLQGDTRPIADIAIEEWERLLREPMRWVKYTEYEARSYIPDLCRTWEKDLLPQISGDIVGVEHTFEFLLDTFEHKGREVRVHGKGTADLLTTTMVVDWKTASRKYNANEKQNTALQPSMYAAAAQAAGVLDYPIEFNYGVMVRGGAAQWVTVTRTEGHTDWLRRVARGLTRQALMLGTDTEWTVNDTHYLCSETWCPYFSVCKGADVAPLDNVIQFPTSVAVATTRKAA